MNESWPPMIGVSGKSGSGKTLLIERLAARLVRRGLRVAVVKHCTHRLEADRPGKDSDRLFKSGAEVLAAGPNEAFARFHADAMPLWRSASLVAQGCDLCLVEGYRGKELPRIEVKSEGGRAKRITGRVLMTVTDAVAQTAETERVVRRFLDERSAALPTMALILIGGRSRRMGRPKSMLKSRGESVLERVVAAAAPHVERMLLGGRGVTPPSLAGMARLPDAPGLQGPLAGILSAMRWRPEAHWLVLACDLPLIEARAVLWLLSKRRAGADALLPRLGRAAPVEPLFALYEPTCRLLLELAARDGELSPRRALAAARLLTPVVPLPLRPAWTNVNTPDEWRRAQT